MAHMPSLFHGRAERASELVTPSGSIRAALLLDRRMFVVGEKVVVDAVVCNQTDQTLHCSAVLQQASAARKRTKPFLDIVISLRHDIPQSQQQYNWLWGTD